MVMCIIGLLETKLYNYQQLKTSIMKAKMIKLIYFTYRIIITRQYPLLSLRVYIYILYRYTKVLKEYI
jgi:hypothetical protein